MDGLMVIKIQLVFLTESTVWSNVIKTVRVQMPIARQF